VVPYRLPAASRIKLATGCPPSAPVRLCSTGLTAGRAELKDRPAPLRVKEAVAGRVIGSRAI
jgi:hypothetical protein